MVIIIEAGEDPGESQDVSRILRSSVEVKCQKHRDSRCVFDFDFQMNHLACLLTDLGPTWSFGG
jgi:hypothetical protein